MPATRHDILAEVSRLPKMDATYMQERLQASDRMRVVQGSSMGTMTVPLRPDPYSTTAVADYSLYFWAT
jgi:hypothetical protein